jgi:hypothetical protein
MANARNPADAPTGQVTAYSSQLTGVRQGNEHIVQQQLPTQNVFEVHSTPMHAPLNIATPD